MIPPLARPALFAIPGDLSTPTGGYEYARQVLQVLPGLTYLALPGGFPRLAELDLKEVASRLGAVPAEAVLLVDGLVLGVVPGWVLDAVRAPIVGLVHHPLFLETGICEADRAALRASEHAALVRVAHVITTSASTALLVAEVFGVSFDRMSVAEPGTLPAARAVGGGAALRLLAVGAVVPRKGYDLLVEALAGLVALPWTLTIVGALDRDAAAVTGLRAAIASSGLTGRVILAGTVDRAALEGLYAAADVFVIASRYEGYGMVAAEAMARGIPLVASDGGALAATIPDAAGVRFVAGDAVGLRGALRRMVSDPVLRAGCAQGSWSAGLKLPRWEDTAGCIVRALSLFGG